jgi:type IV pilus assembly protein PilW
MAGRKKTMSNKFMDSNMGKQILAGDALNNQKFCFFNFFSDFHWVKRGAKQKRKLSLFKTDSGMTLVELLVTLAVGSIIIAAIYSIYISQVQGQATQRAALEMQQGLRAAMTIMDREIRTAGVDPLGTAGAEIIVADVDAFHFTRDIAGLVVDGMEQFDGDTEDENEDIRYGINTNNHLGREIGGSGGLASLLDNVDVLNFVYLDRAGNRLTTPITGNNRNRIRQVQVTVVVRYGSSQGGLLRAVTDTSVYRNQQGEIILDAQNDTFRRLMMTTTITCRNMAIGI